MNNTKDGRPRTPKEQAGNFIASIGGMMRRGAAETELAARMAELIGNVNQTARPAELARGMSRAMAEWADVHDCNPQHARDLASLCGSRAKGETVPVESVIRAITGEAKPQQRRAAPRFGMRP